MLLWHVGGTIALTRYAFRDDRMDLRLLIVGALLPDLVDKPIAFVTYTDWSSVRLIGHSLLFASLIMVTVLLSTRRGRPRKKWMPLAIGVLLHLVLDFMWTDPQTLWWPLLGWGFTPIDASSIGVWVGDLLRSPWTWVGEVAGLAYLVALARRSGLAHPQARSEFYATGRVNAPIDRRP